MKKTDEPGWPMAGGLPFLPFSLPGAPAAPPASPSLLDGMAGGIDLIKDFWNRLPGTTPVPGFLVPTVNVEELDKRIADLRAAEKWVEVNLNLLRSTIQGLEVQRHTIAAIHSLSTMAERPSAVASADTPAAASAATPEAAATVAEDAGAAVALAAGNWLGYLQDQFGKVAGAALSGTPTATRRSGAAKSAARKKPVTAKKRRPPRPSPG